MSLYDEQIRQRIRNDEEMLASSYRAAENAVLGRSFSLNGNYPENAVGAILKYFRSPVSSVPENGIDAEAAMSNALNAAGIMKRSITLYGDWYRSTWGVYLVKRRDNGEVTAVIPRGITNLQYYDPDEAKFIRITKKNAGIFENQALCLYRPLPQKTLTVSELFSFCVSVCSAADVLYLLLMLMFVTLLGLITPKISYFMFSQVAALKSMSLLLSTFTFGVFIGIAAVLIGCVYRTAATRIGVKMRSQVESATMMRVLTLPLNFFSEYSAGDLSQRVQYMQEFCVQVVNNVLITGFTAVFSLAYFSQVLVYAPSLAPAVAVIIIVSLVFYAVSTLYQYKVTRAELELNAENLGMAYDTISGIEKIKLAGAEKRMFARYGKDFTKVARVAYNPPLIIKLSRPISLFILLAGQFTLYYLALANSVDYASYYAFQTAYASIAAGLSALSTVALNATRLFGYFVMIRPIIETAPEINENLRPVNELKGSIELNNVSFRYGENGADIIKGMNLKIRPGEYVAIVGKSGCGKSTLVRLLLGFARPRTGAVYYDGKDLNTLEKSSLRRKIGVVMQNDGLFTGSIYDNITVSVPGAPVSTAWKAAEISGIADDIRNFPMGMNTIIGEGNGGFSGGQRQRIVIARAVAPEPRILIFDEATGALDNKTQKQVSEALDSLNCTRIVIAHRLSTIKHCSRILYMEDGNIAESGTYDELMKLSGRFADLVERQQLGE